MLMDSTLFAFVIAALIVLLIPGPGVVYVVTRSVTQGRQAGLVSAAGLSAGAVAHVVAATVGMSTILLASATAFSVVKILGAGYLIYLGVRTLTGSASAKPIERPAARSLRRLFLDGVMVSVLNPKVAVFFLAFLPQFADPGRGSVPLQVFLLGLLYCALALITDGGYALLASELRGRLGSRLGQRSWPRYASGTVYIGLGVSTALVDRNFELYAFETSAQDTGAS